MQKNAKKFTFELEQEEAVNSVPAHPGVLKFHGINVEAPKVALSDDSLTLKDILSDDIVIEEKLEKSAPEAVVELKIVQGPVKEEKKSLLELKSSEEVKKVKKKKFKNHNYFGVKNHLDLFEIGKHYTEVYQRGVKSFAFHGDHQKSVQHTILGLSSFFNYHKGVKSLVFLEKFEGSDLAKLLNPTHVEMELLKIEDEEESYEVISCDGVDVVEMHKLKHLAFKMGMEAFNEFLENVISNSEIIFWDLPEASSINKEKEFYLPILNVVNSLGLVVDTGISKIKKVKEMSTFAGKYQVNVEGVIMYKNLKRS